MQQIPHVNVQSKFAYMPLFVILFMVAVFIIFIFNMQCKHTEKMLEIEVTHKQFVEQHTPKTRSIF